MTAEPPSGPPPYGSAGSGSYPPPPPGGGYPAPGYYAAPPPENNQLAVWSMVLGILGVVCCGIVTGIPAIVLGVLAKNQIDASAGRQTGRGFAIAGFWTGIASIAVTLLSILSFVTLDW